MPIIVYSKLDSAGANIASHLKEEFGFQPAGAVGRLPVWRNGKALLIEVETSPVEAVFLEDEEVVGARLETDYFVFASRHASKSGKPTLTVHPCGNPGSRIMYLGAPGELGPVPATRMALGLRYFEQNRPPGFEVSYEATHHSPTNLRTPLFFLEIGSTEREWVRKDLGELGAKAMMHVISQPLVKERVAIGLGGIHYPMEFKKEAFKGISVGHMIPAHGFEELNSDLVRQAVEKSVGDFGQKADLALIDWKSLRANEREKALGILKELNLEWRKV